MRIMWTKAVFFGLACLRLVESGFGIPGSRLKRQDSTDLNIPIEFFNNCSCVLYYQCDDDGFIITNGKGLITIRTDKDKENGEGNIKRIICNGGNFTGELVCCKFKPGEENKSPVTAPATEVTTETTKGPNRRRKIECGEPRPFAINVRVYASDEESVPLDGEFPWLAAIYKRDSGSTQWKHFKSGSLIHPKVILTPAHVVGRSKANELKVIVNGLIVLSQIGVKEIQERNVVEIVTHPQYSSGTLYNDVSLLILEEPYNISATPGINTICLRPEIPYENKRCFVAGWGKTTSGNITSEILTKVELPTHAPGQCQEMLQKTRLGPRYVFHKSFICAGGEEGKDACVGDGGSPLVCPSGVNDTMYQVGMVAYGIGCGMKDVPGVYVNVVHAHSWIVEQLKSRKIDLNVTV